jgi:uncharacterized protein YjbI with pentapeptide repeats
MLPWRTTSTSRYSRKAWTPPELRPDLFQANLSQADLRGANLDEANLRGANLSEANLSPNLILVKLLLSTASSDLVGGPQPEPCL